MGPGDADKIGEEGSDTKLSYDNSQIAMLWDDINLEDLKVIIPKTQKTTCCKSYLLIKGRCFTCPDQNNFDPDRY